MAVESVVTRPSSAEHAAYFGRYIGLVEGDLFHALSTEIEKTRALLSTVSEERSLFRYADGKWSIREVLGHLIDAERIFVYRATRFARGDETELPGFDENLYVENASFDHVPLAKLLDEFSVVRRSTIHFFSHLTPEAWDRSGLASGNRMSVRAWAWTIAGHEIHHRRVLTERYLA